MNDKDREAFQVFLNNQQSLSDVSAYTIWQAACEYMRDEFKFQTPPAVIVYQEMNEKLQAENAKLKEVLCFYANGYAHEIDDSCNASYEDGNISLSSGKRARQVLKELEE